METMTLEDYLRLFEQFSHVMIRTEPKGINKEVWDQFKDEHFRTLAIIQSMTVNERRNPELLDADRQQRIAQGSGTSVALVNDLINAYWKATKQFEWAKKQGFLRKYFRDQ